MGKIKVSKEVGQALKLALENSDRENLLEMHVGKLSWQLETYAALNELSNWKMAQILINGYEVEGKPEERLLEIYKFYKKVSDDGIPEEVIEEVLDALNIKIKGIND